MKHLFIRLSHYADTFLRFFDHGPKAEAIYRKLYGREFR